MPQQTKEEEVMPIVKGIQEIQKDQEISEISKQVPTIVERATNYQITSEEDLKKATEVSSWIRKRIDLIEARRKFFTDPLNAHIKKINAFFKTTWTNALNEADEIITTKMIEWRRKEAERIRKEQEAQEKKVEKQAAKMNIPADFVPVETPIQEQKKSVGAGSFSKRWVYKEIDIKKVPLTFIQVNDKAVKEAIKNGVREIPGLEIYEEEYFSRG